MKNTIKTPLFWDLHIHGACGVDFMHPNTSKILQALKTLRSKGIGYIAPTLLTSESKLFESALKFWGEFLTKFNPQNLKKMNAAIPIGLHLEGPFLNELACGAHPKNQLKKPNLTLLKKYIELSQNRISIITLAPELTGSTKLIKFCKKAKIRVQLGHTTANETQIHSAHKSGATGFTHLFNAMKIAHRNPAALTSLLKGKMNAEIITDGAHIDPSYLYFILKSLHENLYSVSDACSALHSKSSSNTLGSIKIVSKNNPNGLPAAFVQNTQVLAGGASFLTSHPEFLIKFWEKNELTLPEFKKFLMLFYKIPNSIFKLKTYVSQNNYFNSKTLKFIKTDQS